MSEIHVDQIREAGVVGAGGAGFPTYVKLAAQADTVLINAAECEPLLHKDKEVLRAFADQVIDGLGVAMRLTGAQRGVFGVKEKYGDVIEAVRAKLGPGMEVLPLRDVYPAGDEFTLTYYCTGRIIPPGAIPLAVGVVVMNVETAMNVAAADRGPVVEKFVSVAGGVAKPVTLRVPVGVTLRQCIEAAGGVTIDDPHYVVGGVMMGYLEEDLDALVTKTTGGVLVLPPTSMAVSRRKRDWNQVAKIGRAACDQCSFCTELCPRYLLGHPIEPHRAMRSLGFNLSKESDTPGTEFCCECNLCSFISCPEDLDPKEVCAQNKARILKEQNRWTDPPFMPSRAEAHLENRSTPTSRLIQRLGLSDFRNVGPLVDDLMATDRVGIALKQHIGAPCEPVVRPGESVTLGQVVGRPPVQDGKPALGAPVHASIAGRVAGIDNGIVWIEK
jgi:Na+-translocating ferredoxin:NAD+ oxidoreductase RnfC subunit